MENSDFKTKYGYEPEWLMPMLSIFNKTEMKRDENMAAKVNRAFLKSQVVASIWLGDKLVAIGRKAPDTCIHLTSTFGNEEFYKKLGFRFHKTAMALYPATFGRTPYLDWED